MVDTLDIDKCKIINFVYKKNLKQNKLQKLINIIDERKQLINFYHQDKIKNNVIFPLFKMFGVDTCLFGSVFGDQYKCIFNEELKLFLSRKKIQNNNNKNNNNNKIKSKLKNNQKITKKDPKKKKKN